MRRIPWTLALTLFAIAPAHAVDHNNLDSGRPLSFDDAETLAFREQALDLGLGLHWPRRRPLGAGLELEYLNGIALNTHLGIGLHPSLGGRADTRDTRFDFGDVTLSALHNFRREVGGTPAFSLRADAALPSGRDSQGADFRLRGILSRQADQYGRLHLNLDLNAASGSRRSEREFFPSAVLGYSRPIGMPRDFTTTGLAEMGVSAGPDRGRGPVLFAGIGIRKQISPRSVVDVGLQSDLAGWNGAARDRLRLVLGYSVSF